MLQGNIYKSSEADTKMSKSNLKQPLQSQRLR